MIVAIDGPSGAGKGTLAKALADRLKFAYLDTGLLFRALALKGKTHGVPTDDIQALSKLAETLSPNDWQQEGLRTFEIAQSASIIGSYPPVRETLKLLIQTFAHNPGKAYKGAVLDGRDIGTVVCPNAEIKLFITASLEERAKRRFLELQLGGFTGSVSEVLNDIKHRDERDQSREADPLKPAIDAVIIDTTFLSRDDVLNTVLDYILKSYSHKAH